MSTQPPRRYPVETIVFVLLLLMVGVLVAACEEEPDRFTRIYGFESN